MQRFAPGRPAALTVKRMAQAWPAPLPVQRLAQARQGALPVPRSEPAACREPSSRQAAACRGAPDHRDRVAHRAAVHVVHRDASHRGAVHQTAVQGRGGPGFRREKPAGWRSRVRQRARRVSQRQPVAQQRARLVSRHQALAQLVVAEQPVVAAALPASQRRAAAVSPDAGLAGALPQQAVWVALQPAAAARRDAAGPERQPVVAAAQPDERRAAAVRPVSLPPAVRLFSFLLRSVPASSQAPGQLIASYLLLLFDRRRAAHPVSPRATA